MKLKPVDSMILSSRREENDLQASINVRSKPNIQFSRPNSHENINVQRNSQQTLKIQP